jgi:hypothetical protein
LLEPTYKPTAPDLALCFRLGLIIKIRWAVYWFSLNDHSA